MRDQADKLRQLVRQTIKEHPRLEPGIPLVVLSGGTSGIGTTTTTIQLAYELALLGKRVVLVDANLQEPSLAEKLAVDGRGSITDILNGNRAVIEVLETVSESISLIPGRWAASLPPVINHEAVVRLLDEVRALQTHADIAIFDVGHGMSPWASQLWRAAHEVLLLTSTDSAGVMESYSTVKHSQHADLHGKLRLLITQADDRHLAQHVGNRFAETCQQFLDLEIRETLPIATNTESVALTKTSSRTFRPSNAYQQSVRLLAAEILTGCVLLSNSQQPIISKKMSRTENKIQTA